MESLLLPSKIRFAKSDRPNVGVLTAEPFAKGYGTTVGNSLRRVLLSSLPGAAVTAVKIKGAEHEFATLPNVKEDVLEIIMNLKSLRVKCHAAEPVKLSLKAKGESAVTAAAFEKNADVEIMNPELTIATLTDGSAALEMEITIEPGRGYRTTDERGKEKMDLGTIAIDALYNPVLSASYKVEETRLGERTDYDKLVLSIETDGSMDPLEACRSAVTILLDHLNLLKDLEYEA